MNFGIYFYILLISLLFLGSSNSLTAKLPPIYGYKVIRKFPHDPNAFTQGLVYHQGHLYEGTGLKKHSSLRKVDLETGQPIESRYLADNIFGEGITVLRDKIFQLTWKSHTIFIYDLKTLSLIKQLSDQFNGWGLTTDGTQLLMSDGSSIIYRINPENLQIQGQINVHNNRGPIRKLNELEYVGGRILANQLKRPLIFIIDPTTGKVDGVINIYGLFPRPLDNENVPNGIAFDPETNRLFITAKRASFIAEIKLKCPRNEHCPTDWNFEKN